MDFNAEMNSIGNADLGSKYINEPCVKLVMIKSYKLDVTEINKKPYLEIVFETIPVADGEDKMLHTHKFWRVTDTDTEQVKEIKNKRIKELLMNAGADFKLPGEQVLQSIVGNRVYALFKVVEKSIEDKNNHGMPIIKDIIEYSFSSTPDKPIVGTQKWFRTPLSPEKRQQHDVKLAKWQQEYGSNPTPKVGATESQPSPNTGNDDDLPF